MFYRALAFLLFFSFLGTLWGEVGSVPLSMEFEPSALRHRNVHVVSGEYVESRIDLVVRGAQPIEVRRVYLNPPDSEESTWRFQRERLTFRVGPKGKNPLFWVETADGRVSTFVPEEKKWGLGGRKALDIWKGKLVTQDRRIPNTGHGELSGRSHPRTVTVEFHRTRDCFALRRGNGEVSYYYRINHGSPFWNRVFKKKNDDPIEETWCLRYRRLPNGNWLSYHHNDLNDITKIEAYAPDRKTLLSWVTFTYQLHSTPSDPPFSKRLTHFVIVEASDGQCMSYLLERKNQVSAFSGHLKEVSFPDQSNEIYHYDHPGLKERIVNDRSAIRLDYYARGNRIDGGKGKLKKRDDRLGRVKCFRATTGEPGEAVCIERYSYDSSKDRQDFRRSFSYVDDAAGLRTYYFHTSDHLLITVGNSCDDIITERLWWGGAGDMESGNLMTRVLYLNPRTPLLRRSFHYDERGNVLREVLSGDLSGKGNTWPQEVRRRSYLPPKEEEAEIHTILRTYSEDGFNLCLSEEDGSLRTEQEFLPYTDLIIRKKIYYEDKLQEEWRYRYNELHQLIEEEHHCGPEALLTTYQYIKEESKIRPFIKPAHVTFEKLERLLKKWRNQSVTDKICAGLPLEISRYALTREGKRLLGRTRHQYNENNLCIAKEVYDAADLLAYTLSYSYDRGGRVTRKTDPLGRVTEYAYDANGNCIQVKPPSGCSITHYCYDHANRLVKKEVHPTGAGRPFIQRFTYDLMSRKIGETDIYGEWTHYTYDAKGRIIQILLPGKTRGPPEKTSKIDKDYDAQDRLIRETNPLGEVTTWSYNSRSQPVKIEYPDGTQERKIYDLRGQVLQEWNRTGARTEYTRNYKGDPTAIRVFSPEDELLSEHIFSYEGAYKTSERDPSGITTFYHYDAAGRLIEEQKEERRRTYTYDTLGRLSSCSICEQDQVLRKEFTFYDLAGQLIEERIEDPSGRVLNRKTTEYDLEGRPQIVTCHDGEKAYVTSTQYDILGRPLSITNPLGESTSYTYDHDTQCTTMIDPLGRKTITSRDARGNRTLQRLYDSHGILLSSCSTEYDEANQKVSETHRALYQGKELRILQIKWEWGPSGQLLALHEGEGLSSQRTTRYFYNCQGLLAETHKPDGTILYKTYDCRGLLLTHSGADFHYTYTYDAEGRWRVIASKEQETSRTYTAHGQLQEEQLAYGGSLSYRYDAVGRCTLVQLSQGPEIHYTYGPLYLQKVERRNPDGTLLYAHHYGSYDGRGLVLEESTGERKMRRSYDALGRPLSLESPTYTERVLEYREDGALLEHQIVDPLGSFSSRYEYDQLTQLISEEGLIQTTYSYDSLHNRLKENNMASAIGSLNEIQQDCWGEYTYDANGRITLWKRGNEELYLEYDTLDRLISITAKDVRLLFTYDPLNRRLTKELHHKIEGSWKASTHLTFLYQQECDIGALGPSGKIVELRTLGLGRGVDIGSTLAVELDGVLYFALSNLRGSIVQLINQQGEAATYRYTAFGIPLSSHAFLSPWGFMGKRVDHEVGWVYFGQRHYLPQRGRWLTPDPKGYSEGPNLYAYCYNRLFSCLDLLGLSAQDVKAAVQADEKSLGECSCNSGAALGEIGKSLFSGLGMLLNALGDLLLCSFGDLGGISSGCQTGGMLLQGSYYRETPYGEQLPSVHLVGYSEAAAESPFGLYINGMNTPLDYALESAENFSQKSGLPLLLLHNPTHGLVADFASCCWGKLGGSCPTTNLWEKVIRASAAEAEKMGIDKIPIICHSQGCMLTSQALSRCEPMIRERFSVSAFGPAKYIANDLASEVTNYCSWRDPIGLIHFSAIISSVCGKETYSIEPLPPSRGIFFDHGILNPCYHDEVIDVLSNKK